MLKLDVRQVLPISTIYQKKKKKNRRSYKNERERHKQNKTKQS